MHFQMNEAQKHSESDSELAMLREFLQAVIEATTGERNRFGKFTATLANVESMRELAVRYKVGGAEDIIDQINKVARALSIKINEP